MTPIQTSTVLELACASAGIAPVQPELIREGENSLWRAGPGVVARISRSTDRARIERELQIAHWLAEQDFPAVRPVAAIEQPVLANGHIVTFWEDIGPHEPGTPRHVARLLRRLHALQLPTTFTPVPLDPFVRLESRLQDALTLDDTERAALLTHLYGLQQGWGQLPPGMDACLLHGDAWVGNVAELPTGEALLLDLERSGTGPPEWDLVSTAIKLTSFAWITDEEYRVFCGLYGSDVTSWTGYPLLRDIRELRMTSSALQLANVESSATAEARFRVQCILGREGQRPWNWRSIG
jgi:aminoglycoside phosphotransferase